MLDELSKSVKASLYERVTSPLFGTFIISWCIWNYKTIFVLLSSLPVDEKIDYIELFIYADMWTCISRPFVYPLITALLFIFIYPYPALFVYKYWHKKQKLLKEEKQKIEDETPLTIEESRSIRRELFRLETEYDKEIARKDSEIERLKELSEELSTQIEETKEALSENQPVNINISGLGEEKQLDEDRIEILKLISSHGGVMKDVDIIPSAKFDKVKTEYFLEDLESSGYLSRVYKSSVKAYVSKLTTKSKKLMVDIGHAS